MLNPCIIRSFVFQNKIENGTKKERQKDNELFNITINTHSQNQNDAFFSDF